MKEQILHIDYQQLMVKALAAEESGEMVQVDPKVLFHAVMDFRENLRIRDIMHDQLADANKKLNKIKRVLRDVD